MDEKKSKRTCWERLTSMEGKVKKEHLVQVPYERKVSWKTMWIDWKLLWLYTGPGWLMSLAYLDPGNLESDLQMGAYSGYQLIWVLWWCTVAGLLLQILAARLGVVTGLNLAQMSRKEYPRCSSMALWIMTEIAIIGSDIQEVLGSAIAINILCPYIPLWGGALITGADTFTFLFLHACGARKLEAFICVLILTMATCFFINVGFSQPDALAMVKGTIIPGVPNYGIKIAVGTLGAVIMPHNIYLHSALVQSRNVPHDDHRKVKDANKYFGIESGVALFVSFFINLAVVITYARQFFKTECATLDGGPFAYIGLHAGTDGANTTCVSSGSRPDLGCCEIGLADTALALNHSLGSAAKYVWAVGLLAAGQASTMTGVFAGQFVMEGFLQIKCPSWIRLAITRSVALVPAVIVAVIAESNPTLADGADQWLNILQSIQLPFALLPVLHFTSSPKLMGKFANNLVVQFVVWGLALLLIVINVYFVINFTTDPSSPLPTVLWQKILFYIVFGVVGVAYIGFIGYLVSWDVREWSSQCRMYRKGGSGGACVKACCRNNGKTEDVVEGETLQTPFLFQQSDGEEPNVTVSDESSRTTQSE